MLLILIIICILQYFYAEPTWWLRPGYQEVLLHGAIVATIAQPCCINVEFKPSIVPFVPVSSNQYVLNIMLGDNMYYSILYSVVRVVRGSEPIAALQ